MYYSLKYYVILVLLISSFLTACSKNDTPDKAVNEIITAYNNADIETLWNRTLPSNRFAVSKNMIENIDNRDLFDMMGFALNKDNATVDNFTAEEFLYGTFRVILGDKEMELNNIEKVNDNTYTANIKIGEKTAVMPLRKENNMWYMQIE